MKVHFIQIDGQPPEDADTKTSTLTTEANSEKPINTPFEFCSEPSCANTNSAMLPNITKTTFRHCMWSKFEILLRDIIEEYWLLHANYNKITEPYASKCSGAPGIKLSTNISKSLGWQHYDFEPGSREILPWTRFVSSDLCTMLIASFQINFQDMGEQSSH